MAATDVRDRQNHRRHNLLRRDRILGQIPDANLDGGRAGLRHEEVRADSERRSPPGQDSPEEEEGFEPSVPLTTNSSLSRKATPLKDETESLVKALSLLRGTEGTNSLLRHPLPRLL